MPTKSASLNQCAKYLNAYQLRQQQTRRWSKKLEKKLSRRQIFCWMDLNRHRANADCRSFKVVSECRIVEFCYNRVPYGIWYLSTLSLYRSLARSRSADLRAAIVSSMKNEDVSGLFTSTSGNKMNGMPLLARFGCCVHRPSTIAMAQTFALAQRCNAIDQRRYNWPLNNSKFIVTNEH